MSLSQWLIVIAWGCCIFLLAVFSVSRTKKRGYIESNFFLWPLVLSMLALAFFIWGWKLSGNIFIFLLGVVYFSIWIPFFIYMRWYLPKKYSIVITTPKKQKLSKEELKKLWPVLPIAFLSTAIIYVVVHLLRPISMPIFLKVIITFMSGLFVIALCIIVYHFINKRRIK